ncbi:hypothetical protein WJ23_32265 [Burkholderia lata]|uniref:FG-GAP repeat protein n=1 Tax=Burkholderia contaminans TaxID=488447 RepID=A0A6P3BK00_9BURK|nr:MULTISPECIES: hypothetical protein [Burkholderia cepacia complex]AOJ42529.1 hypothetical protein WJ23_32265 [Burkholderia lata]VWD59104.1 hypothetical protein BCO71033_06287 [Burkholderia contaminans]
MKTKALLAVLLVLLGVSTAVTAFAQESEPDPCLVLRPTQIAPDDVGEAGDYPGGGWLGLIPEGHRWTLAPARVRFEPSQPSGDIVDIKSDPSKAVALFRCKSLRQGKVEAANLAFPKDGKAIEPGARPLRFGFHGRRYALRHTVSGAVIAEGDGKRSVLHDFGGSSPPFSASLIWAGDLDRDGRLDFLMEFESDLGASFCLFTSGSAKENELVGDAGCMYVSG